jgi:phenylacetate-CoA ligase
MQARETWGSNGHGASHANGTVHGAAPPRPERDLYAWAYEKIRHGAWERFVKRRPIPGYLDQLEKSQWLSAAELEAMQLQSLRDLLVHAQTNVPYYKELFGKIGFDGRDVRRRSDIGGIPLLTKEIIRERYDDLIAPEHRGKNIIKGTSGSTGVPLKFELSLDSNAWREAMKIRGYRWAGFRLGGKTFHYWGQAKPPTGMAGAKIRLDRAVRRDIFVDSMQSDEASMRRAVELLRKTRPNCLVVYTQSCALWARFILEHNLRDWPDIPVICGAEAVLPQDRTVLERAFGRGIFETYGSREVMLMAAECDAHEGMHLAEENVLLEVVKNGAPLGPGESGEVAVTDLHNYGFPFIRYVNGDLATMGDAHVCPCGRGLRKLKAVDGRRADTLHDKEGKPIPGLVFHVLMANSKDVVSQFQAIQKKDGSVTLKIVRGQEWDPTAFNGSVSRIEGYLRGLPLQIEECREIPVMPNGKRRTIIVET